MTAIETLLTGYGLLEGPVWDGSGLVFSDVTNGGLHRLGPDGAVSTVLPHRRGMGGVVPHADGGYVVSGRNVARKTAEVTEVLLEPAEIGGPSSFNDVGTDARGRVYVGSLESDPFSAETTGPPGKLYRVELDGAVTTLADDVLLTNGIAVSPDGRALYHCDSLRRVMWRYTLDDAGEVTERDALLEVEHGLPDGIAVAADGAVWVAVAHAGIVAVVEPDGRRRADLACPVPMVTSVCFGGPDLTDLYVVTGPDDAPDVGGGVYRVRGAGPGLPVPPARVRPRSG